MTLCASLAETGDVSAFTLLRNGLWFVLNDVAYQYDFVHLVEILRKDESATWPDLAGVGDAYVVGPVELCDEFCACAPAIAIERNFEELELLDPCNELTETYEAWCLHFFDYEITLCEGRTLQEIVFAGTRGRVFIEGVGYADTIVDWSVVPLTGRFWFQMGLEEPCGAIESTMRVTVIDNAGCCVRITEEIACCRCCAPGGSASLHFDDFDAFADDVYTSLHPANNGCAGVVGSITCDDVIVAHSHRYCFYRLDFHEGETTDCGLPNPVRYLVTVEGGITAPDGASLVGSHCFSPGQMLRFRHDDGGAGANGRITITPFDSLGCFGDPQCIPFRNVFTFAPGEQPETSEPPCLESFWSEYGCTDE